MRTIVARAFLPVFWGALTTAAFAQAPAPVRMAIAGLNHGHASGFLRSAARRSGGVQAEETRTPAPRKPEERDSISYLVAWARSRFKPYGRWSGLAYIRFLRTRRVDASNLIPGTPSAAARTAVRAA